jgi:hypothetical protein
LPGAVREDPRVAGTLWSERQLRKPRTRRFGALGLASLRLFENDHLAYDE